MGNIQLELLMPSLRKKMDNTPITGDIDLSWDVKNYLMNLSEDRAWEAASRVVPFCQTDLERFDGMLSYLFSQYTTVNFYPEIYDGFKCSCTAHYDRFTSDTRFGALAKCVLYGEYFHEVARIESKHPPKKYKQGAIIKRIMTSGGR